MKKILTLLIAAAIMLTMMPMFSLASDLEPMEITVSLWDIARQFPEGEPPSKILQAVEDKFNVKIIPMAMGWDDNYDKLAGWAISNSLPDIAGGAAWTDAWCYGTYLQWVDEGVVRALPDDLSAYPNIEKYVNLPDIQAHAKDGKTYFLPRMAYLDPTYWCMDRGLLIRTDWLEALGLEMPKNMDDLMNVIQAFVENDPGQNNAIGLAYDNPNTFLYSQYLASFGYTDSNWVKVGDEWKLASCEEIVVPLADWCRTAYKNGWFDQDFASRAPNDVRLLFASGRIGVMGYQNSPKHVDIIRKEWVTAQPDKDFMSSVGIVPLEGENASQFQAMSFWSETYIPSTVDDAKMERILMIMDWLYSDEGVVWTFFGEEGVDFYYDDRGEIIVTLPVNEESGKMLTMVEQYPDSEFLSYLAAWNGDMLQYVDPNIPVEIRDMCTAEYERRIANWVFPNIDWEISLLDLPEKTEMTVNPSVEWSQIVADASDTPTAELYLKALEIWNSQGYEACWNAVTEAAATLGK